MEKAKAKFCPAMWLSGFFGLGALVHLVRVLAGFSVVIAGREIPITVSVGVAVIFGILSVGLLVVSLKKPCESGTAAADSTCCK